MQTLLSSRDQNLVDVTGPAYWTFVPRSTRSLTALWALALHWILSLTPGVRREFRYQRPALALRSSVKQVLEEALEPKFVSYELISLEVLKVE